MVILPNNHILNLKMRQITRLLPENVSKSGNISLQIETLPMFEEIDFLVEPPAPL